MWAKMEELARGRLERKVKEGKARNKAEMDSLRRDMVAWKDQAETMCAVRGEAAQERRVFQAKALRLEREALALGDEVRSALKIGKTLSSAELKGFQKLLKRLQGLLSLPLRGVNLRRLQHHLPRHCRRRPRHRCRPCRNKLAKHLKHHSTPQVRKHQDLAPKGERRKSVVLQRNL